jgi:hypothetical protein
MLRRKSRSGFLSPLKFIVPAGFEPKKFESNGKYDNYWTTQEDFSHANGRTYTENVLRRTFGAKKKEDRRGRILHN